MEAKQESPPQEYRQEKTESHSSFIETLLSSEIPYRIDNFGDKQVLIVRQSSIAQWIQDLTAHHHPQENILDNKWCARIATGIVSAANNTIDSMEIDEERGYTPEVISCEYRTKSQEGYTFHSIALIDEQTWNEDKEDYDTSQLTTIDMTAPNFDPQFDVIIVSESTKTQLQETLHKIYGAPFSL